MNVDLIIKLGTLAIGAIGTFRLTYDWLYSRKGRLRDEYKFASEFIRQLKEDPEMHPFLKQKGYQAIAGDPELSGREIEYLLTLKDSAQALRDYVLGKAYLAHFVTAKDEQIAFLQKYETSWSRLWRKCAYLALYFVFFMGAFAPLHLPAFELAKPSDALLMLVVTAPLFIPPGFLALRAGVRIARAEALVRNQQQHSRDTGIAIPR